MGFFLGSNPEPSIAVLRALPELARRFALPLFVCVSRKSFVGALGGAPPHERLPGTLAAELFAAAQGVDYLRTHDVAALAQALRVARALEQR
jgi:dihydropteroate synthase